MQKKKMLITLGVLSAFFLGSWTEASGLIRNLKVTLYPVTYYFDGIKKTLSSSEQKGEYFNGKSYVPFSINYEGTTYVPIRFVGESLGKEVGWEEKTHSIWIGKKPPELIKSEASKSNLTGIYGISIGQSAGDVLKILGSPVRKDSSFIGYEWWIYNGDLNEYVQIGIKNGEVVDIYSNSSTWNFQNIKVGTSKEDLKSKFKIDQKVFLNYDRANFELENDIYERPLILYNDIPIIFYIDTIENKVSSIRLISKEALIKSRMYAMKGTYYGTVPDINVPIITPAQQKLVDEGNEKQILDITNVLRIRNQLPLLSKNVQVGEVARNHSIDMYENDFFDHTSKTNGLDPFQRMKSAGIFYQFAGENIAMGQPDGIEACEGWMNSMGHRKNILEGKFKTLGVGVKGFYYTQNFVTP